MLWVARTLLLVCFSGVACGLIDCNLGCICLPIGLICDGHIEQDFSNWGDTGGLDEIEAGAFQHADFVTTLYLAYNHPLNLHSESLVGLSNLRTLDLEGNQLESLPEGIFSPLGNITTLNLSHNSLSPLQASWMQGLTSLTSLNLQANGLTSLSADVVNQLPALTNIDLEFNPLSCDNISVIYQLVVRGIADVNLKCNITFLIRDLDIKVEGPYTTSTSVVQISTSTTASTGLHVATPTPSRSSMVGTLPIQTATSRVVSVPTPTPSPTSTELIMTSTIRDSPTHMTTSLVPTPTPLYCPAETTLTAEGYFDWPVTTIGGHVTIMCPNGPMGVQAERTCSLSATWGEAQTTGCSEASVSTQILADISQWEVTDEQSSAAVSEALASSLPTNSPLSLRDVDTFVDIASQLVEVGGASVEVLNNTLLAINNVLESTGETLHQTENSSTVTSRLRQLIDTILLEAVDSDHTHLIISFSHLVVEGFYLPPSDDPTLLAIVHEGVEIMVEGDNTTVQVTVYDDTSLFDGSDQCEDGEQGLDGVVITSVISVSDTGDKGGENVTITFSGIHIAAGDHVQCVRWNDGLNCGRGGWELASCTLIYSTEGVYRCLCNDQGSFTILDVPGRTETSSDSFHTVAKWIYYGFIAITFPLYLTVILAILFNRFLYILPTMQLVVSMAISQGLSFIVMAISYKRVEYREVCYGLSSVHHYLFLVSVCLMGFYPVLVCIRIFRRMLYDRSWLIAPFLLVATVFPAVFVGVYSGMKYRDFTEDPYICWLEADVFLYFTYATGIIAIVVAIVTLTCAVLLACSDYDIEGTLYLQLLSQLVNLLLYCTALTCYYLVGRDLLDDDYMLMAVGGVAILCSIYFFIANAVAKSRVRSALMCREDPVLKQKAQHYSRREELESDESASGLRGRRSRTAQHKVFRREPMKLSDEMNLNYVDSYLGVANPVPLRMLGQISDVQHGKRVKTKKENSNHQHGLTGGSSVV